MFEYFPDNYTWSLGVMLAINMGGEMGEVDEVCRPLRPLAARNDEAAQEAWYQSWRRMGERLERLAVQDKEAGHPLSASRKYLRAATYHLLAERQMTNRSPHKLQTYQQALAAFRRGVELSGEAVEFVEVPYEGTTLPALFLPAVGANGRAPCMVHFDGFDVTKEIIYLMHGYDLPRRGVALLICDHPGVGGALRLRGLPTRYDMEVAAAACVDYLQGRPEVDPQRLGIMALSLGGYYAPRVAAFEKRLKCCVAWGAQWDTYQLWEERLKALQRAALATPFFQLTWVLGTETVEEAMERLKDFRLEGVADKIDCALLVVHGENDRQVPLWAAERTYEAATSSPRRELKVFTLDEGGAEHCQVDNVTMATDYIYDWIADVLKAGKPS